MCIYRATLNLMEQYEIPRSNILLLSEDKWLKEQASADCIAYSSFAELIRSVASLDVTQGNNPLKVVQGVIKNFHPKQPSAVGAAQEPVGDHRTRVCAWQLCSIPTASARSKCRFCVKHECTMPQCHRGKNETGKFCGNH